MAHPRSGENLDIPQLPLALAFTILKSKPIKYSVREYINKLRQQCRVGERNVNHGTMHQYLDAVVHWKECFKDSQVEIRDLQGRLVQLEQEIETLKNTSRISRIPEPSNISRPKQKRASPYEPSEAPSKRTKVSSDSITPNDHLCNGLETDSQALGTSDYGKYEYGKAVVYHIWQTNKSYRQPYSDPSILSHHLSQTLDNLTRHVATIFKNCREQQVDALSMSNTRLRDTIFSNIDKELQGTQRAAGRIFSSLLHGLTALDGASDETINSGRSAVIYSCIQSFDTLLSVMSTMVSFVVLHIIQNSKSPETNGRRVKPQIFESLPSSITTLLLAIVSLLDSNHKSHRDLFEGIMYLLLERVGAHLYFLTFNKERGATIEEDIQIPCLPGFSHEENSKSNRTPKHRVVTTEVKYLTQLLERAMSVAPLFLGSTLPMSTNTKSASPKSVTSKPNACQTESLLALHVKKKLERTLTDAMFGDDGARNEFVERLKKPVAIRPSPLPPKIEDEDVPQWFTEKIWGLVGWDILASEEDW